MTFGTGESLDEIVRRAQLPLSVGFSRNGCWIETPNKSGLVLDYAETASEAARAYLEIVSTMFPANSSPAGAAADCSALASPGVR